MSFNPNKTPIEIIKEGAFGGTYFRDIYRNSWKEFNFLEDIDLYYMLVIIMILMLTNIK